MSLFLRKSLQGFAETKSHHFAVQFTILFEFEKILSKYCSSIILSFS